ncbi:hypothetical protein NZD89_28695 (plasmid) [Alicyclobacillus fastidiosus]|uniref:Uncharacterized protein n=1 Tax=Alicyclobacillus fastidiosus TaxID=392011 RepID=A0ABY6ZPR8_9BACL|nr:hypothetical protein [Alicyclobacillus fastidiosus]WAH44836.1 hypothetical protein NZD89_28695 [Alicyclobacillus fastidiosus]GMA65802.1 hypothetical protein GCM10025859_62420 [Alicyclobacillus fastidiosus]GMA65874.1 hypothetical protein GCM10025859_63150 [Alicyclobacillus fastidiosus]
MPVSQLALVRDHLVGAVMESFAFEEYELKDSEPMSPEAISAWVDIVVDDIRRALAHNTKRGSVA